MTRNELRAACKTAGIKNASKMTVAQMQDALHMVEVYGSVECPHCGIHLSNGVLHDGDETGEGRGKVIRLGHEFQCMACGKDFGEPVAALKQVAPAADRHTGSGVKIEKNRVTQNGITMPSIGGKCRAVWDAISALLAELEEGKQVTAKMVKDLAADEGWNANNASIEFYRWRKFHGFTGRAK